MLQGIVLPSAYINAKQWNVNKMKKSYTIHFPTFTQIIHMRNKVCYFSNRNVISIMIINQGKFVD
jgi:hypothetical protein